MFHGWLVGREAHYWFASGICPLGGTAGGLDSSEPQAGHHHHHTKSEIRERKGRDTPGERCRLTSTL